MSKIKTGIDGINLTFGTAVGLPHIAAMFDGVTEEMFKWSKSPLKWYRDCFTLKSSQNTTLVQFHVNSSSKFGESRLLSISGLCFSDSALNPFRPLNLPKLIKQALELKAQVSKFDVYLDDYTAAITQERLNEMSQPHTFDLFIQSPFLRAVDGDKPEPRYFKGTWYYGKAKRNACEITTYNKGLSTRQKIHSKANPLKFTWQRYELRFAGDTSKKLGQKLLNDLANGANLNTCVAQLFRSYLRFVEPNPTNKRTSSWSTQAWWSDLLNLADHEEAVRLSL